MNRKVVRNGFRMMLCSFSSTDDDLFSDKAIDASGADVGGSSGGAADRRSVPAFLPIAIHHAPMVERRDPAGAVVDGGTRFISPHRIVSAAVELVRQTVAGEDAEKRLETLGRSLRVVSSLDVREFTALVREVLCRRATKAATQLEILQNAYGDIPQYWATDMKDAVRALVRFGKETNAGLTGIWQGDSWSTARSRIAQFGELLTIWSALMCGAGALRQKAMRLARTIDD